MVACANKRDCPCTYNCPRHGKCCECVPHHTKNGEFTACFFTKDGEKTWDRSLAMLLCDRGHK